MTATELYENSIKPLPAGQRLELAKLILDDIPAQSVVDYAEEWSEQDVRDLTSASLNQWDTEQGREGA